VLSDIGDAAAPVVRALDALAGLNALGGGPLQAMVATHGETATLLSADALWTRDDGEAAQRLMAEFTAAADAFGDCPADAYPALFATAMDAERVPASAARADPRVAIWGTLEARMQSADVLVLGGLVEGGWPARPTPDPWLSRDMRRDAGLPSPEALIGLDALDFQQALCAPTVVLTRALKAEGAPTTPSRWLARLTTLLHGTAPDALKGMRARGDAVLSLVERLERPAATVPPAPRPCPRPPVHARPTTFAATAVETLIRDPYAIYARQVLRLRALEPLSLDIDARLRGTVLHKALELFCEATAEGLPSDPASALREALDQAMADAPLPVAIKRLWRARLTRLAPTFLAAEAERRAAGRPAFFEWKGSHAGPGFTIVAKADRIDRLRDGRLAIYDYKTGEIPSDKQIARFAKQMPLMAAIAAAGGFKDVAAAPVARMAHISLGSGKDGGETRPVGGDPATLAAEAWDGMAALIATYADEAQGYLARARPQTLKYESDYDHLSRLGEWEDGADV
jgi:double-strand break repair protein AddB